MHRRVVIMGGGGLTRAMQAERPPGEPRVQTGSEGVFWGKLCLTDV